jgi:hypothetical protein
MKIYRINDNCTEYVFGTRTLKRYQKNDFFVGVEIEEVELSDMDDEDILEHLLNDILYLPEHGPTEYEMKLLQSYAKEIFFKDESLQDNLDGC